MATQSWNSDELYTAFGLNEAERELVFHALNRVPCSYQYLVTCVICGRKFSIFASGCKCGSEQSLERRVSIQLHQLVQVDDTSLEWDEMERRPEPCIAYQ